MIQCKARQDALAEENLHNQHFPCYRPVYQIEAIRHGKRVSIEESLFPGYLFIHLCRLTDSWHSIRSTRGVLRLVTFADRPVSVSAGIVTDIKRRLSDMTSKPLFEPGSKVLITDGPFKDLTAMFSKTNGDERAVILLGMLQRQQALTVPLRVLRQVK